MAFQSVDALQQVLVKNVFHYARDPKKAAGRALGTLVELITFYALKSWGMERHIAIERALPEDANPDITHNVEYSLHPARASQVIRIGRHSLPLTSAKIMRDPAVTVLEASRCQPKGNAILTRKLLLRNCCTICDVGDRFFVAYLDSFHDDAGQCTIVSLYRQPFAIFECKRVGVEEGCNKGPQTIEKAKQGAYVARTVSGLQKLRDSDGRIVGVIQKEDGSFCFKDYYPLLGEIIAGSDPVFLRNLILTVGVVSNHGNWFTSENHNKELKVLAQSYDWLLFLTDGGLSQFVDELLLDPIPELTPARDAFLASYTGERGINQFTKVQIALSADAALQAFFKRNTKQIESWFNVIAPAKKRLAVLRDELNTLKNKNWKEIHP